MADIINNMISSFPSFLDALFSVQMLSGLLIGIFGGLTIGALPGMGPSTAIPLLLPFCYVMDPIPAMVMLMAMYTCGMTGGSYTAILLRTPGTIGNVMTAVDGFPLAQQGKGLKACQVATWASAFGGTFSAITVLFLAPILAKFAILFDSPEYFVLGLLGVSLIVGLSAETTETLIKGLISGAFGFCLSSIGRFPMTEEYRFTFGLKMFRNGIDFTLILLGFYSVSQIMRLVQKLLDQKKTNVKTEKITLSFKNAEKYTISEMIRHLPIAIINSVMGVMIGIMPGAGGNIAAFIGYDNGKRLSKEKELYGKGSIDGVFASEVSNNAVSGGSMIPMMTLGIPGSPVAALLMSGLFITGFAPGYTLFDQRADTAYPMLYGFLLVNVLMLFAGLLFIRVVCRVVDIPDALLNTAVIVLVVVGGYSLVPGRYSTDLVMFLFVFGLIGYFMELCKYSGAALTLGMVLGEMTEGGYRRTLVMAKGNIFEYYLTRPISLVLIAIIVVAVFYPILSRAYKRKKRNQVGK